MICIGKKFVELKMRAKTKGKMESFGPLGNRFLDAHPLRRLCSFGLHKENK